MLPQPVRSLVFIQQRFVTIILHAETNFIGDLYFFPYLRYFILQKKNPQNLTSLQPLGAGAGWRGRQEQRQAALLTLNNEMLLLCVYMCAQINNTYAYLFIIFDQYLLNLN